MEVTRDVRPCVVEPHICDCAGVKSPSHSAEVSKAKAILMALQHCSTYDTIIEILSDTQLLIQAISTTSSSEPDIDHILHDIHYVLQDLPPNARVNAELDADWSSLLIAYGGA
ncbi:hypothetical protein Scep_010229 [Stephania cephalantha]|uniref:Uncharacterized protein n=1 Tax=Stephania cephalantha TaxID=152367 RepID=A0AAP0JUM1_9MAGN